MSCSTNALGPRAKAQVALAIETNRHIGAIPAMEGGPTLTFSVIRDGNKGGARQFGGDVSQVDDKHGLPQTGGKR